MFKEMLAGMRILSGLLWGTVVAAVGLSWRDLRKRFDADSAKCSACQVVRDGAFKEVWDTIDVIAPRHPEAAAAIRAAKRKYAGGE